MLTVILSLSPALAYPFPERTDLTAMTESGNAVAEDLVAGSRKNETKRRAIKERMPVAGFITVAPFYCYK
jgi:hypothetical protein